MSSARIIAAIAAKDLRLLLRDKGDVFFTFFFPVVIAILFGFVFGGGNSKGSPMPIALVVESDSKLARGIAEDLAADASFETVSYATRDEACEAVRGGKATAAIVLPASLDAGLEGLFAGQGIAIDAVVDPSRRAEAGLIQGKLNELAFRQFPRLFADRTEMSRAFAAARRSIAEAPGMTPTRKLLGATLVSAAENFSGSMTDDAKDSAGGGEQAGGSGSTPGFTPIRVTVEELAPRAGRPRAAFDVTFPQGIVWGLAGCFGAFASSLVSERARGTLQRLRLAPIGAFHLISGKAIACLVTGLLVQALVFAVALVFFGARIAQPAMLVVACFAAAFAFAGLAMALAAFCRTEAEANGAGRGAILILALIGGGTIPLFFMPPFLRTLSYGSPFRWAVAAIEGPFWRDTPVAEQLAPLAVLVAIGFLGWIVGARGLWRSTSR
jgi:ABC-2 type transport system permease protein